MDHHLQVSGMTCGHCEMAVKRALLSVDPNANIEIDRSHDSVRVQSDREVSALLAAVQQEGYTANAQGKA